MGIIPESLPGRTPAEQVFAYWRARQRAPERCKLTQPRRRLIDRALRDYEPRDLAALICYAYEADEPGPRFWRGENRDGRTYLDLTNLLSDAARLPGRVEAALAWADKVSGVGGGDDEDDEIARESRRVERLRAMMERSPGEPEPEPERPTNTQRRAAAVAPRKTARWE